MTASAGGKDDMPADNRAPVRIFICYRRAEVAWPANWLYDMLREHFSRSEIFKDVDSIELGDDFVASITSAVESCDVLLAVIGPTWLTSVNEDGKRRLEDPDDFVRIEIQTALRRDVRVIPVLVDGAVMPTAKALPRSLQPLARRQALEVTPGRFREDAGRLIKVLERSITQSQASQQAQAESPLKPARAVTSFGQYEQPVSRPHPGCVAIMVDQSAQMAQRSAAEDSTLADEAARLANEMLLELCLMSQVGPGVTHHYFDVGVFGYGPRPDDAAQALEGLLPSGLGPALSSIPDIRNHPRAVAERQVGGETLKLPVWVEPGHGYGYGRPVCRAIAELGQHVYEWAQVHPDSFPPLIINITCGLATDIPYDGTDLATWIDRITGIGTNYGTTLLANVVVLPDDKNDVIFPSAAGDWPQPAPQLFMISNILPAASTVSMRTDPRARLMGINKGTELVRIFPFD
jgi:TIR domain